MTGLHWANVVYYSCGAFMGAVFTYLVLANRHNAELDALAKRVSDLEEIYDHP